MSDYFDQGFFDLNTLLGADEPWFDLGEASDAHFAGQQELPGDESGLGFALDPRMNNGLDSHVEPYQGGLDMDLTAPIDQPGLGSLDFHPDLGFDGASGFDDNPDSTLHMLTPLQLDVTTLDDQSCIKASRPNTCRVCNRSFSDNWELDHHCRMYDHGGYECDAAGCDKRFLHSWHLAAHQVIPHVSGHHLIFDWTTFICAECGEEFKDETQLRSHAKSQKHTSFECSCGVKFVRIDVAHRHIKSFSKEGTNYPCTYCKRHRGKHAFRRRDHLVQHLRGYHKFDQDDIDQACPANRSLKSRQILTCPHEGCESYRDDTFRSLPWKQQEEQRPFDKQSDYSKHMRGVHEESLIPCRIPGCERVGVKGYMREKDLMKHIADKHPDAPNYVLREADRRRYICDVCNADLTTFQELERHQRFAVYCHPYWRRIRQYRSSN